MKLDEAEITTFVFGSRKREIAVIANRVASFQRLPLNVRGMEYAALTDARFPFPSRTSVRPAPTETPVRPNARPAPNQSS
jgi:hypothetical protein